MCGDSGVGKSNMLLRYMNDKFDETTATTLGVEFSSKYIKMNEDETVRAQLWDTVGDERFRTVSNIYLKGAVGALLVYDITSRKSFNDLKEWLGKLNEVGQQDIVILMVGNKTDLEEDRVVS